MAIKFETPDFTKTFETFFKALPTDTTAVEEVFKNASEFAGKYSDIVLGAAQKNVDLSASWTKDTLSGLDTIAQPQKEMAAYAKVATDVVSGLVQAAPERITEFAEVAKQAQLDTVELVISAGKKTATPAKATKAAAKTA